MKKITLAAVAAFALSAMPAFAADMPVKAARIAAQPSPWDFAFGSAVMNDYVFRGITQSNHKPSVAAYFEPRYNINKDTQLYVGLAGESISFPNRAAAEIDLYGGIRPTFGKLALDFGVWYYWYPGGTCFNANVAGECAANADAVTGGLPINGNFIKKDLSFVEIYAKATYNLTDAFSVGAQVYWSPSVLNSGAPGTFVNGTAKYVFPAMSNGMQWYASGDVGYWDLGTSDSFYGFGVVSPLGNFTAGLPYKSYATWDLGIGWTYKVFTVDLRYTDTNLNKGDCNAFTSAQNATAPGSGNITAINPGGAGTNWCGAAFIAKLSVDMTANTNLK